MSATRPEIPLRARLGFRLGLLVFGVLLVVDLLLLPLWNWLFLQRSPEWYDPESLREYAAMIEASTPAELEAMRWTESLLGASDLVFVSVVTAAYCALFALVLGGLVTYLATRRIVVLTRQATQPPPDAPVPGPFLERGKDEIALLGATMNAMRRHVLALLDGLAQKDRERQEWTAEVSHDLRTPLTSLKVSLDQLARMIGDDARPIEELRPLVESARLGVVRVSALADDLLEIARLDAGDELLLEPVPPGQLLRDVARSLTPIARAAGVDLQVRIEPDLPELRADGRRLLRALENLTLNSIQHAGEVVLLSACGRSGALELAVEDDGPGLPGAEADQAFPVLTGVRSRRDSAGIGLEVARKVVAAHGGEISAARSDLGGAAVVLRLEPELPTPSA